MPLQLLPDKDTVVGPFTHCIFCESDGGGKPLTDEHAIPAALGGRLVLKDATCDVCRRITSAFESRCINTMFQGLRMNYRFTSARGTQKRPKLPLTIRGADNTEKAVRLGRDTFPSVVAFPEFAPPTLITREPDKEKFGYLTRKVLAASNAPGNLRDLSRVHNATMMRVDIKVPEVDFGRLLAKVAHCWGVATLGVDGFSPLLKDAILKGDQKHLSRYVGGDTHRQPPPDFAVYEARFTLHPLKDQITGEGLLVLEMESFAGVHLAPIYTVCFGRFNDLTLQRVQRECSRPGP